MHQNKIRKNKSSETNGDVVKISSKSRKLQFSYSGDCGCNAYNLVCPKII